MSCERDKAACCLMAEERATEQFESSQGGKEGRGSRKVLRELRQMDKGYKEPEKKKPQALILKEFQRVLRSFGTRVSDTPGQELAAVKNRGVPATQVCPEIC
ncbi:mCG60738 [Mus musculus]|uniref:Uncharacterized protein n=1 Tax=Mus musculus TaxID=10090 RepID=Q9D5X9_MOUSE|nr:mCG60738 [Mus musculus]BAB29576.1 unnamed protein product [Mus musculus]